MANGTGTEEAVSMPPASADHPEGLAHLIRSGNVDRASIERLLAAHDMPLIGPGRALFLYRGAADAVDLVRWIHAGADRVPFERGGDGLWVLLLSVEDEGRFEYKLAIRRQGQEELRLDPLNPARAGDPFGENSVCRTWGYARPDWTAPAGAPAGRIEPFEVVSRAFGEVRREHVYLPAGYAPDGVYPLVIVHDGSDYVAYANLAESLDNLIAARDVPPLVAALIQSRDRVGEYARGRRHARYLVTELLPALEAATAISRNAEDRVLMGASLGAVASLATAFRFPGLFGGLVLKSGSFILDEETLATRPHPVFERTARLVAAVRRAPEPPATRAFVSTGELEGLAETNRRLAAFLDGRGVDVRFKSAWDGHHWHNWRDQLRDGLMWVLRRNDT